MFLFPLWLMPQQHFSHLFINQTKGIRTWRVCLNTIETRCICEKSGVLKDRTYTRERKKNLVLKKESEIVH